MKVPLLLGLLLAALLCGCASTNPYSETMIDTNTQHREGLLPEAPHPPPLQYAPGLDSGSGMMGGQ